MTSAADILRVRESRTGEALPEPLAAGLDVDELASRIWVALESGETQLEDLAATVGAAPGALASALLELELAGLVRKLLGPRYARCPSWTFRPANATWSQGFHVAVTEA